MASFIAYHKFKESQIKGPAIDFDTDDIRIALVKNTYVPDAALHSTFANVSANEVSGSNYAAGGAVIQNKTVTLAAGVVKFDGDDITWGVNLSGFTDARYAILYSKTSNQLVGVLDLGQNYGNSAGDFTLRFDATGGIFTLT